jgi:dTDP-4-amino-4,6-dideoxygalactose transaminase
VITVPFTFVATVAAIEYAGATPVLIDVEPEFLTMDPTKLEAAITPRTKAIIPVHLFGQPADMDPIIAIARKHNLVVIEDACQAHGSEYKGKRCGSIGQIGCFSFYPGKNLGAYGEGGAVVTSDPEIAKKIRLLRAWGEETRYEHKYRGFNYRMDGVQGAILGVKLRYLQAWTEARRRNAAEYARRLAETSVELPRERRDVRHVYHLYVVRLQQRDAWRERLNDAGVQTGVHYPIPVHLQPAYRDLGYAAGAFPVCERAAAEVLSLPMFPELTSDQIAQVALALTPRVGVAS